MTDLPPQSPVDSADPYSSGKRGRERSERSFGTRVLKKLKFHSNPTLLSMSQRAEVARPNFRNVFSLAQWTDLTEHHTDTLLSVYPGVSLA